MFDVSPRRLGALAVVAAGALALLRVQRREPRLQRRRGRRQGHAVASSSTTPRTAVKTAEQLAKDFTAKNPDITVKVETRPRRRRGRQPRQDPAVHRRHADVFMYNSGSLFQALNPTKNLVPLDDEPWVGDLDETLQDDRDRRRQGLRRAVRAASSAAASSTTRPSTSKLGLEVPKTWAEFMANNAKIKAAGIAPVIQTYEDTWTSQLFVLGDFHNVAAAEPDFAEKYTNNQAKYATTPAAIKGFEHLQEVHDAGYLNEDFASAKFERRRCKHARRRQGRALPDAHLRDRRRSRPTTRTRSTTSASSRCPATTPPRTA